MTLPITTDFDDELKAFIVTLPEFASLEALQDWRDGFLNRLWEQAQDPRPALLLDTRLHQFESIACLKLLREFFSDENQARDAFSSVAFVQPRQYRQPEIVSPLEAYFCDTSAAHAWLARQASTRNRNSKRNHKP